MADHAVGTESAQIPQRRIDPVAVTASPGPVVNEATRVARHALVNNLAAILSGLLSFLLVPYMLHRLGAGAYGVWVSVCAVVAIAGAADLGIGYALVRAVAADRSGGMDTRTFCSAAAAGLLLTATASSAAVALLGLPLSARLQLPAYGGAATRVLFGLGALALFADQIAGYGNAVLSGLRKFELMNGLAIWIALLRAVGIVVMLQMGFGLVGLAAWNAVASTQNLFLYLLLARRSGPAYAFRPRPAMLPALWHRLGFSVASQITALTNSLLWELPAALIGALRGPAAVVPYYVGQRFPLALLRLTGRSAEVVYPAAAEHQDDAVKSREVVVAATRTMLFVALPLAIGLWILAPNLLLRWIGDSYPDAVLVLRLTTAAVVGSALGSSSLQMIWGRGQVRALLLLLGSVNAVFVAASVALLRMMGASGPAWVFFATSAIANAVLFTLAAKACRTHPANMLRDVVRGLLLPATVAAVVLWSMVRITAPAGWAAFAGLGLMTGIIYLAAVFLAERTYHGTPGEISFARVAYQGYRGLRAYLSRWQWLRTNWYFGVALVEAALDGTRRNREEHAREFREPDPYGLESPLQRERFATALELLDQAAAGRRFTRAMEIGCGEGHFTELLVPRCQSLLAADLSPAAMQRAKARCAALPSVTFREWNLRRDALDGTFQLVVIMSVLEYFRSRRAIASARSKLVAMLEPGGYLLVSNVRTPAWMENAWWAGYFVRGGMAIDEFIAAHPELVRVAATSESWYVHALFRKDV